MLAARIDRLALEDKRLLQVASVVGKDVPFLLLQAIAELPDEALRRGLDRLQWLALLVGLASATVWAHVKAVARDRRRRLRGAAPRELARAARRRGH